MKRQKKAAVAGPQNAAVLATITGIRRRGRALEASDTRAVWGPATRAGLLV